MLAGARLLCAAVSDTGLQRKNNEDRVFADADLGVFLVVDGVGGHAAGEKAADTALKVIRARLARRTGTVEERIREAITLANNEIFRLSQSNDQWRGMACVLTLAVVEENRVAVGHVGDSRCYQLRAGSIFKLTHDHSPIGELEDRGDLSEAAAMAHPRRNEIFRDAGSQEHTPDDPDFVEVVYADFGPEAALLLCSDGLSDQVPSEEIRKTVEAHAGDPAAAARTLIARANSAGGKDNTSIVIVEGPQYAVSTRKQEDVTPPPAKPAVVFSSASNPSPLSRVAWLLAGMVFTAAAFWWTKPYLERSAAGLALGFGEVRRPAILEAGDGRAFPTISAALAAARPGDRILVSSGTYRESIALRDQVVVESAHTHGAVLESSGVAVSAENVRGARFSGFRIRQDRSGSLQIGLRLVDAGVEVSAVEVTDAREAGVEVIGSSQPVVMASRFVANWGPGIVVRDSASPRLLNNFIIGNGKHVTPPKPGVVIYGAAEPLLSGNVIYDNGAEPLWVSPLIRTDAMLRDNLFGPATLPRGARPVRVIQ